MIVPAELKTLLQSDSDSDGPQLIQILESASDDATLKEIVLLLIKILGRLQNNSQGLSRKKTVQRSQLCDLGSATGTVDQIAFIYPRGKHTLGFLEDKMVIRTAKQDIQVQYSAVSDVVILDSIPKDTKERVWILLHFKDDAEIMNGKTKMACAVIQVHGSQELTITNPKDAANPAVGNAAIVLCQTFGSHGISPQVFHSSDETVFQSFTKAAAVEAFVKARQGYLFPLRRGLCFLEAPAIFISTSKISCLDFARAGGASSTFDLHVFMKDGSLHEFSNISRHELGAMEDWARAVELPIGSPLSGDEGTCNEESEMEMDEEDDEDDDDFDPFEDSKRHQSEEGEDYSSDEDSGVELVSEEDFTIDNLKKMMDDDAEGEQ